MSRLGVLAQSLFVSWVTMGTSNAQLCPPIPTPPGPDEGGAWVATTATPTCTLENGGYIKRQSGTDPAAYKVHFGATVTGGCQTRTPVYQGGWICVNGTYQPRHLGTSSLWRNGVLIPSVAATGVTQHLDTSVPTGTTQTGSNWVASTEGTFTYTSLIKTTATSCNLSPTESPGTPFVANVVKCAPVQGTKRFAPAAEPVLVYVPYTWAYAAVDDAITQWNSVGVGVIFQRTTSPCGNGSRCLTITGDTPPAGYCGFANAETDTNGVVTANATVAIYPDQQLYSDERLKRTMSHEMGHLLGLDDYDCASQSEAVMENAFGNCVSSLPVETALQPSDKIPARNSAYGGQQWAVCGF